MTADKLKVTEKQAHAFSLEAGGMVLELEKVLLGKRPQLELIVAALIAGGHILLEDVPGTGKTTLARAVGELVDGKTNRIQFTPDLLPSDIVGVSIADLVNKQFEFKPGPVFANILLADEINRASPKTQSALLEVMEERQVTVDGKSWKLEDPFMVIATENPIEHAGTYPLPEAQLDRFMVKTSLGLLDTATAVEVLEREGSQSTAAEERRIVPINPKRFLSLRQLARDCHIEKALNDYIVRIVEETRTAEGVEFGASIRGALSLQRMSKVKALMAGRNFVLPDDIKSLASCCLAHRIVLTAESKYDGVQTTDVVTKVLGMVTVPR